MIKVWTDAGEAGLLDRHGTRGSRKRSHSGTVLAQQRPSLNIETHCLLLLEVGGQAEFFPGSRFF